MELTEEEPSREGVGPEEEEKFNQEMFHTATIRTKPANFRYRHEH